MENKLVFVLLLIQFWQMAMPNPMVLDKNLTQLVNSNKTTFDENQVTEHSSNFPIQVGNKFYHISVEVRNWFQAAHICRQLGGHLLNFENSEEMNAVLSLTPNERFWTSGNCLAKNREWISIATGEPMPYQRWDQGEPNNPMELCIELTQSGLLNDVFCDLSLNYICEAKII